MGIGPAGLAPAFSCRQVCGRQPRWSRDARELYFISEDGWLMALPLGTGAGLRPGRPEPLFRPQTSTWFDVGPDGRFLMIESVGAAATEARIQIVLNFDEELTTRVPID